MTSPRVAVVVLVDPNGCLLLQERDAAAAVAPNVWGFVGGHVEPGEEFEAAAYRELQEETGINWASGLTRWFDGDFLHAGHQFATRVKIWVGRTVLGDADIVVGEGRQIVFVEPARFGALDLSDMARWFLPRFLESETYGKLITPEAPGGAGAPRSHPLA